MHVDKEPEPLNLWVPVVNFPRANAILAREQALLWVRDWDGAGGVIRKYIVFIVLSEQNRVSAQQKSLTMVVSNSEPN